MYCCKVCNRAYMWAHDLQRHMKAKHNDAMKPSNDMLIPRTTDRVVFQHPFTMMVSGPSGSGKTRWTRRMLLSELIQPSPDRIIWCYGQWQPLYEDLQQELPSIEFIKGIPDYLNEEHFVDTTRRNMLILQIHSGKVV